MTSKCQVKESVPPYLTLNQKLEVIKFSEGGVPEMIGWKLGLFLQLAKLSVGLIVSLVDKAVFRKTDSNFERIFTVSKTLSKRITCYGESMYERESIDTADFIGVLL